MTEKTTDSAIDNSPEIHVISEWNMARLNQKIATLNRRADKIGCPHVEVKIHDTRLIPDPSCVIRFTEKRHRSPNAAELDALPKITVHDVEIVGEGPKIEGWKFVGTLDHYTIPGKVIVNTVPGESVPSDFFESDAICDHCEKIRNRVETFVLLEEATGEYKQVGRNCLRDFFGHDPQVVARFLSRIMKFVEGLGDEDEGWGMGGGRQDYSYDSLRVLTNTIAVIRTFGWVPRSASDEDNCASSNHVLTIMLPAYGSQENEAKKKFVASIKFDAEKDLKEANEAIAWLKDQEGNNEYMHNLKLLEDQEAIPGKMFGYWCSLAAAFQRAQARLELAEREKKTRLNEYFGEVGERYTGFQVKCIGISYTDSFYGTVCIHRMVDTDGRTMIWFANSDAKMEKGNEYIINARVKKQDEYKEWKQTYLTRVSVREEIVKKEDE